MFRLVPRIAVILLLVAGTVAPAAAGDRPVKGSGKGEVFNDALLFTDVLQGHGRATHFGRTKIEASVVQDYLRLGIFYPVGGGWLTTASGDSLYFVFNEEYSFFDPATGVISTKLLILGGTGHFLDARGDVDVKFVFDSNFSHFLFLIDGSINY